MEKFNGFTFFTLGKMLTPVADIPSGGLVREHWLKLWMARGTLSSLLSMEFISFARPRIEQLIKVITGYVPDKTEDLTDAILDRKIYPYPLKSEVAAVETVLSEELAASNTYFVSQKGIYATPELIEYAENMIPDKVRAQLDVPTKRDLNQAGRCLALDVPTASGYHVMRATERVLLKYRSNFIKSSPDTRDWGTYIRELRSVLNDPKPNPGVVAILDQIRTLHRNPLMHPEDFLSDDEAMILLSICSSVICAMVGDLKGAFQKLPTVVIPGGQILSVSIQ